MPCVYNRLIAGLALSLGYLPKEISVCYCSDAVQLRKAVTVKEIGPAVSPRRAFPVKNTGPVA
jgi:hypothetical protein